MWTRGEQRIHHSTTQLLFAEPGSGTTTPVGRTSFFNQAEPTTEPWASVEDVAKHLGVAKDAIYRWIVNRRLPAHQIGRLWKFKLSEVDPWVRAGGVHESVRKKDEGEGTR